MKDDTKLIKLIITLTDLIGKLEKRVSLSEKLINVHEKFIIRLLRASEE